MRTFFWTVVALFLFIEVPVFESPKHGQSRAQEPMHIREPMRIRESKPVTVNDVIFVAVAESNWNSAKPLRKAANPPPKKAKLTNRGLQKDDRPSELTIGTLAHGNSVDD